MKTVDAAAQEGVSTIYFAKQFPGDERHEVKCQDMKWYDARGNLSFMTNDDSLAESVMKWSNGESKYEPPKCIDDLQDKDEATKLLTLIAAQRDEGLARAAFTGEVEAEIKE